MTLSNNQAGWTVAIITIRLEHNETGDPSRAERWQQVAARRIAALPFVNYVAWSRTRTEVIVVAPNGVNDQIVEDDLARVLTACYDPHTGYSPVAFVETDPRTWDMTMWVTENRARSLLTQHQCDPDSTCYCESAPQPYTLESTRGAFEGVQGVEA